jgi:hypothetical protein
MGSTGVQLPDVAVLMQKSAMAAFGLKYHFYVAAKYM